MPREVNPRVIDPHVDLRARIEAQLVHSVHENAGAARLGTDLHETRGGETKVSGQCQNLVLTVSFVSNFLNSS